jgi:seryl-tRNA synthetase
LKQVSLPGESERDFRIRLREFAHERRDLEVERLKRKYAGKFNTLERQINTAQRRLDKESADLQNQKMNTALSVGSTLLGMFFGRRSRAGITTAARSATRISKEKQDIERVEEKLAYLQDKVKDLELELQEEIDKIVSKYDPESEVFEILEVRPRKSDILQRYYGLVWVPFAKLSDGSRKPLTQELVNL